MKTKALLLTLLLTMLALPALATEPVYGVKLGLHNPKATTTGLLFGFTAGSEIDERFDAGLGIDFFRKTYTETTEIVDPNGGGQINPTIEVPDFESSVTMIPIMANVKFKIPMGSDFQYPLLPYVQLEGGYVLSWYGFTNYETDEDESKFFGGWGLRFGVGAMYQIGSSSRVSLDVYYMSAKLSREDDNEEIGRPVITELDLSGVGIRIGLLFGGGKIE